MGGHSSRRGHLEVYQPRDRWMFALVVNQRQRPAQFRDSGRFGASSSQMLICGGVDERVHGVEPYDVGVEVTLQRPPRGAQSRM